MLFIHPYKTKFFSFLLTLYVLNKTLPLKTIMDKMDLLKNSYYSMKHRQKKNLLLVATKLI